MSHSLNNQFQTSLNFESNKPDFRELDLGSPVSPLMTRHTTSSSSSSSGSISGRNNSKWVSKKSDFDSNNHSGELSGSDLKVNQPLIYSGQSSAAVNSPPAAASFLPAGNICPSGKILKSAAAAGRGSRTDVLGSGVGYYGHGSIIRGNAGGIGGGPARGSGGGGGESVRRAAAVSVDPEEVKRAGNELYKKGCFGEALNLYDRAIGLSPGNAAYRSNRAAALTGLGRLTEAVRECEEAVRLDPNYGRAHQRLASLFIR